MKISHWCIACLGVMSLSGSKKPDNQVHIVVVPDTQTYLEKYPELFDSQMDWITQHQEDIDAVLQVGDFTQSNLPLEWYVAKKATDRFSEQIPFGFAFGNHDMGSRPGQYADTRDKSVANRFYTLSDMQQKSYWGGSYSPIRLDNYYLTFQAEGHHFLLLNIEFGPSDSVLNWANDIAQSHPKHLILLNTHSYLYSDSTQVGPMHDWQAQNYGIGKDTLDTVNDGAQIWEKFVRRHSNILAVFSGHVLHGGVGTLVSRGDHGNKVYQMLANFQSGVANTQQGKENYLRVVTLDFLEKTIDVKSYSPHLNRHHEAPYHNFTFRDVDFLP